jgi:hypothetical protein
MYFPFQATPYAGGRPSTTNKREFACSLTNETELLQLWTTDVKDKVRVTSRRAVFRQSVRLGVKLLETHDQRSFSN